MKQFQILQQTSKFSLQKVKDTKTGKKWYAVRVPSLTNTVNTNEIKNWLGNDVRYVSDGLEWRFSNLKSAQRVYSFLLLRWS